MWIYDLGLRRVTFLNSEGGRLGDMLFHPVLDPPLVGADPVALLANGMILAGGNVVGRAMSNSLGVGGVRTVPVLLMTRAGKVVRQVAEIDLQVMHVAARILRDGRPGTLFLQQPFNDDPLVQAGHDGKSFVIVERRPRSMWIADEFSVTKMTGEGDTIFSKRFRYTPHRIDDAAFDQAFEAMVRRSQPGNAKIDFVDADVRKRMYRPEALAPVQAVRIASDGTIWLRRESEPTRKSVSYMVLGPDGKEIAEVLLPEEEQVMDASSSILWVSSTSSDGAPVVISYRIRR